MMSRLSNFELLRFIAMIMILLVHANYAILGDVTIADFEINPIPSFARMIFEQICIVAVNVFILISGWFGIKPSIKGATSLIFQVIFYAVIITALFALFSGDYQFITFKNVFPLYYMYWFVAAYLILYALSPILNAFSESATKTIFTSVLLSYFALEMFYGFITDLGVFQGGYSAMHFIGMYLLARYMKLHTTKLSNVNLWINMGLYLLFTIMPVLVVFCGDTWIARVVNSVYYNSPFVILASVFLFLVFVRMNFQSNVVNWLAASSFAIYVIHSHPLIFPIYADVIQTIYQSVSVFGYIGLTIVLAIIIGVICVIIDQMRIIVWRWLSKAFLDKCFAALESSFTKIVNE